MRVRVRKHLFEELLDLEFALCHFLSGKGANKDFARMTDNDQEFWLLFVRVVKEQVQAYQSWLLTEHEKRDPQYERLHELPPTIAARVKAVKGQVAKLQGEPPPDRFDVSQ